VHPVTRNRLPPAAGSQAEATGVAAIRQHVAGPAARWASPLGRAMTELAILVIAREYDQPYEWSLHVMEAYGVGLDRDVIEVVRDRKPVTGLRAQEAVLIEVGRAVLGRHRLSPETYARAVEVLGQQDFVALVDMATGWIRFAASLTAFNQQMPPGWRQMLPLPFTPPDDIHPDSRNRLPLILRPSAGSKNAPELYSRTLSPAGTGPGQISAHGGGLKSLEASAGRRAMALATLITAREHDQQYAWTMDEPVAVKDGLEPAVVEVVRLRQPVSGLAERDAALIEFGRELFGKHYLTIPAYKRALAAYGERDLVDIVALMGQLAAEAALLTTFDQQLPEGVAPRLPLP
jgi:4-carboxymuconolactone decarboxylase